MNDDQTGTCLCCGRKWRTEKPQETRYSAYTGIFPLCVECWGKMSPEDRLPFYETLILQWEVIEGYEITAAEREEIKAAVLAGK